MTEITQGERFLIESLKNRGIEAFKCSICHNIFYGYGWSAYPIKKDILDRCCQSCKENKVIPARMKIFQSE